MTLRRFAAGPTLVPAVTSFYLADLGEGRGKQELFTRQSPQRLKVLREHALIESAVSRTLRRLHVLGRAGAGDAGKYKERDSDIIEKYPDGRVRVRFRTVPARRVPAFVKETISFWRDGLVERSVPPVILMAAANLDFLCIHPFRDGNGRVSRLLLLLQCYHLGYEVGRYISLERLIEDHKDRYHETLEESSRRWHEAKHDPWPYINFLLYILKAAYVEFEERLGQVGSPRGAKTELVEAAVHAFQGEFTLGDLERACPGVSRDMVRRVLRDLRVNRKVECLGRGPGARWRKRAMS